MPNYLLFSDYFKNRKSSISFGMTKMIRRIILIFKWNHSIKTIRFNYYKNWQFDNGYFIIDYAFKNAVWFEVLGIKKTSQKQPLVLDLKNINQDEIEFIVYGLLSKKKIKIKLNNTHVLNSDSFKKSINNINVRSVSNQLTEFALKNWDLIPKSIVFKKRFELAKHISNIKTNKIKFHLTPFNQNDFI